MKREGKSSGALIFLLATAPLMFSQVPQGKASPALPSDILGPQLIAWSQVQKPQPMAEPRQRAEPQPETQQSPQQSPASRTSPASQTMTGTILKDGDRYVLKVAGSNTYVLDDQDRVKQYEGKQVRVAATLEADGHSLHIISIELIS
jgi:Protein of unknown function (DUF5818)